MIYSKDNPQQLSLTISLTQRDRQIASNLAQQQSTQNRIKQVYQNTLAVLAVNHYLEMLDITTDLQSSDSWNKVKRIALDTADLKISDQKIGKNGHIECRPLLDGEKIAYVPLDVWEQRISYLFVQLNTDYTQGKLLGFLPYVSQENIPIHTLYPLAEFLDHLYQPLINWVRLRDWLENSFAEAWQDLKIMTQPADTRTALAFRYGNSNIDKKTWVKEQIQQLFPSQNLPSQLDLLILLPQIIQATPEEETRWQAAEMLWEIDPYHPATGVRRVLDLGMELAGCPLALMVALLEKSDQNISILLRLYPMRERITLPPNLRLVIYKQDNIIAEVKSRFEPLDKDIQLKLVAKIGERFSVKISLKEAIFQEYFIV
jgi:hypothetical protein